jgi:hypothetical protein
VKKLLDRIGKRGPIVMAVSAVVFGLSLQPFIGTDGWAGLGQWVGGLGALVAAWVALDIAGREARHREEADAHQDFVRANFITIEREGDEVVVSNRGTEPVTMILLTAYQRHPYSAGPPPEPIPLLGVPAEILMPMLPPFTSFTRTKLMWNIDIVGDPLLGLNKERLLHELNGDFVIEFTDLRGNRWRRVGDKPAEAAAPSTVGSLARSRLPR